MKFYNTTRKLAELERMRELSSSDHSHVTVITGRRRIGKASLIIKLVALFFSFLLILAPYSCITDDKQDKLAPDPCTDCLSDNPDESDDSDNPDDSDYPKPEPEPLGDVTDVMRLLGNPLKEKYADGTARVYARNMWDMHAFNGKIYFGTGNSANSGPAANAGPADLYAFTPAAEGGEGEFTKEYTVNEEQIHLIREFDGELYLPGHDSRESWTFGNFYRLESGEWKKYRTIPWGIHVYDILKFNGRLYAAVGPDNSTGSIQVSEDNGMTWSDCGDGFRVYTFLPLAGTLYSNNGKLHHSGEGRDFVDLSVGNSRLSAKLSASWLQQRLERAVVFGGATFYVAGITDNDHQYLPRGLIRARTINDIVRLGLPEGALPRDLLLKGEWLLALISTPAAGGTFVNAVLATKDADAEPEEWMELFRFTSPAFARSFEYMDGVFYFGLGCDFVNYSSPSQLSQATGDILSIPFDNLTE